MDEEYELMPQSSFSRLKQDLENIKAKASGSDSKGLNDNIKKLSDDLGLMIKLMQTATDEMRYEEQEAKLLAQRLDPLADKIDMIIDQNEQIAKGIVAVADLIKEMKEEKESQPKPKRFAMPPGPVPGMPSNRMDSNYNMDHFSSPMPPKPFMPGPKPLNSMPMPPPPMPEKKAGFLGMFKK